MRNEGIPKFIFSAIIILAILAAFNVFALHTVRRQYALGVSVTSSLFDIAGQTREWIGYIKHWKDISTENARLRDLAATHVSTQAIIESLQAENDALKKIVNLSTRLKRNLLPAGMFNISLSPDGYRALINKGSSSGVVSGQTVISTSGELIGKVITVFSDSSQIILVADPDFSVTVRVLGRKTSGIAYGALDKGISLNFITQADIISEGDTIVTTGDDLISAGLIIGTVRSVENNDTQLFKKVNVNLSIEPGQGSVVIIQP